MNRIKCAYCGFVAFSNEGFCKKCKQELIDIAELPQPVKFGVPTGTGDGTGIKFIDYQRSEDGSFKVMKWIVLFYIPILPLSAWEIVPTGFENTIPGMCQTYKSNVLGRIPLKFLRILRIWAIDVISLAPIISASYLIFRFGRDFANWAGAGVGIGIIVASLVGSLCWLIALHWLFTDNGSDYY